LKNVRATDSKIPIAEIEKKLTVFVGGELAKLGIKESGIVESFLSSFEKEFQQLSRGEVIPSAAAKQELPQEKQKQQSEDKGKEKTEKAVSAKPADASTDNSTEKTAATKPAPTSKSTSTAQMNEQPKTEKKETIAPSVSSSEKPKQVIVTPKPASPSTAKPDAPKISDPKGSISAGSAPKTQQTLNEAGQTIAQIEGTLKQLPQSIKTQSASQKQETQQTLSELKQKLMQLQEALKQLQNESIKKQVISTILPIAKMDAVKMIEMPKTLPMNLPQGNISDASKLRESTAQEKLTPVNVTFTQTFDGLFTQSANSPGSRDGIHSGTLTGTLTDGTRVNVKGDSIPGDFTGSFSGQSIGEPGYTPATHTNSAFSGSSVGTASAKGFKEGDLKGSMTVTVPAGTQTATVSGNITIKTDGSLSMPSYSGPVTVNATGTKVGTMSGAWNQSKTTP